MLKNTEHFISYYYEAEELLAEEFITLLEEKYEEIHKAFNFSNAKENIIFICARMQRSSLR